MKQQVIFTLETDQSGAGIKAQVKFKPALMPGQDLNTQGASRKLLQHVATEMANKAMKEDEADEPTGT